PTIRTQLYPLSLHDALPISILTERLRLRFSEGFFIRVVKESVGRSSARNCFSSIGQRQWRMCLTRLYRPSRIQQHSRGYFGLLKDRKSTRLNSSHVAISYAV